MTRLSPITRISLGLTSLVVSLLLLLDIVGLIPDELEIGKQVRHRTTEALAIHAAVLLQEEKLKELGEVLQEARDRNEQIVSIGIRRKSGDMAVQVGEHGRHWVPPEGGRSTLDHLQIPLFADRVQWGAIEISFAPALPTTLTGWLAYPTVRLLLVVAILGFVLIALYLRRALLYLNPSEAVPERVRQAYDTLTEGVAVLDRDGRVIMANRAFEALHPEAAKELVGKKLADQKWLSECIEAGPEGFAWDVSMRENAARGGLRFDLKRPDGTALNLILQTSPILDPKGVARGCLVSFDNVTEVHRINEELSRTLIELDRSREAIRLQNEELQKLASRDPLTGCLNRRAFFAQIDDLLAAARTQCTAFCCIMADIDHFKRFNDTYGHAVGDEVIIAVVHTLQSGLRAGDLLCRYGGEEFCIAMPGTTLDQAVAIAERLREWVESRAGTSVRSTEGLKITSSFGVALLTSEVHNAGELIERADAALYRSKEGGRNRVTVWTE
jgi:diguanylate cyclase (GGDEF)-like protein/PAS domain S-box-containing protein